MDNESMRADAVDGSSQIGGAEPVRPGIHPARRGPRRRWVGLCSLILVLAVAGGWVSRYFAVAVPAGAEFGVKPDTEYNTVVYKSRFDVGSVFTDGAISLFLEEGTVTLKSVKFSIEGNSVRQVGQPMVAQLLPDARSLVDTEKGYPLDPAQLAELKLGAPQPIDGAVLAVPPGRDHQTYVVLVGLQIIGPGRSVRSEVDVIYELEGHLRKRRLHLPISRVVCSPRSSMDADDCNFPNEE